MNTWSRTATVLLGAFFFITAGCGKQEEDRGKDHGRPFWANPDGITFARTKVIKAYNQDTTVIELPAADGQMFVIVYLRFIEGIEYRADDYWLRLIEGNGKEHEDIGERFEQKFSQDTMDTASGAPFSAFVRKSYEMPLRTPCKSLVFQVPESAVNLRLVNAKTKQAVRTIQFPPIVEKK